MPHRKHLKFVVAGNGTLDAVVQGTVHETPDRLKAIVVSNGVEVEFVPEDGPIRCGHKHRTNQNIEQITRGLMHQLRPGGGGYNTVTSIGEIADYGIALNLHYVDVSTIDPIVERQLRQDSIPSTFFGLRTLPVNAVIGGIDDKIIFKGPPLDRKEVDEQIKSNRQYFESTIGALVDGSHGVVINSAKDPIFVELILDSAQQRRIPLYFVITDSLPPYFVFGRVLPSGISILNHEDIVSLYGKNPLLLDDKQLMEMALEFMKQIRKDRLNNGNDIYVTLGRNGVFCTSDGEYIFHVVLKGEYAARVSHSAITKPGGTIGAGDRFAAAVVYYKSILGEQADSREIAERASIESIKHFRYQGRLSQAFNVTRVN